MLNTSTYTFLDTFFSELYCQKYGVETNNSNNLIINLFTDSFLLLFVYEGQIKLNIGGESYSIKAGEQIFIPQCIKLSLDEQSQTFKYFYAEIGGDKSDNLFKHILSPKVFKSNINQAGLYEKINNAKSQLNLQLVLLGYITDSVSALKLTNGDSKNISSSNDIIESFINYVYINYNQNITVQDICKTMSYSTAYFTNLFKKSMGISPRQFIIDLRINRAKQLLSKYDMPVKEVAEKVGYLDSLYFSKEFKRITGLNPTKYQEINRNINSIVKHIDRTKQKGEEDE